MVTSRAMEIVLFITIALGFTLIPGPNAMLIMSTSVLHGTKRGLQVALGISIAIALQLTLANYFIQGLAALTGSDLQWMKWIGFTFLAFLFIKSLRQIQTQKSIERPSGKVTLSKGFLLALSNPKSLIFFTAVLLPFAATSKAYKAELGILSIVFWSTVTFCDVNYAIFSAQIKKQLQHPRWKRLKDRFLQSFNRNASNTNKVKNDLD